mmetsp:Transcript_28470/g.70781  ORF Transcript_28470/g.70781 Transcript_28470/m.70781 type:complete len:350 (-) Transcript_28470:444-1493(-)
MQMKKRTSKITHAAEPPACGGECACASAEADVSPAARPSRYLVTASVSIDPTGSDELVAGTLIAASAARSAGGRSAAEIALSWSVSSCDRYALAVPCGRSASLIDCSPARSDATTCCEPSSGRSFKSTTPSELRSHKAAFFGPSSLASSRTEMVLSPLVSSAESAARPRPAGTSCALILPSWLVSSWESNWSAFSPLRSPRLSTPSPFLSAARTICAARSSGTSFKSMRPSPFVSSPCTTSRMVSLISRLFKKFSRSAEVSFPSAFVSYASTSGLTTHGGRSSRLRVPSPLTSGLIASVRSVPHATASSCADSSPSPLVSRPRKIFRPAAVLRRRVTRGESTESRPPEL